MAGPLDSNYVPNGCRYHNDCFTCPYDDCILSNQGTQRRSIKGNPKGGNNHSTKCVVADMEGQLVMEFDTVLDMARHYNLKPGTLSARLNRPRVYVENGLQYMKLSEWEAKYGTGEHRNEK